MSRGLGDVYKRQTNDGEKNLLILSSNICDLTATILKLCQSKDTFMNFLNNKQIVNISDITNQDTRKITIKNKYDKEILSIYTKKINDTWTFQYSQFAINDYFQIESLEEKIMKENMGNMMSALVVDLLNYDNEYKNNNADLSLEEEKIKAEKAKKIIDATRYRMLILESKNKRSFKTLGESNNMLSTTKELIENMMMPNNNKIKTINTILLENRIKILSYQTLYWNIIYYKYSIGKSIVDVIGEIGEFFYNIGINIFQIKSKLNIQKAFAKLSSSKGFISFMQLPIIKILPMMLTLWFSLIKKHEQDRYLFHSKIKWQIRICKLLLFTIMLSNLALAIFNALQILIKFTIHSSTFNFVIKLALNAIPLSSVIIMILLNSINIYERSIDSNSYKNFKEWLLLLVNVSSASDLNGNTFLQSVINTTFFIKLVEFLVKNIMSIINIFYHISKITKTFDMMSSINIISSIVLLVLLFPILIISAICIIQSFSNFVISIIHYFYDNNYQKQHKKDMKYNFSIYKAMISKYCKFIYQLISNTNIQIMILAISALISNYKKFLLTALVGAIIGTGGIPAIALIIIAGFYTFLEIFSGIKMIMQEKARLERIGTSDYKKNLMLLLLLLILASFIIINFTTQIMTMHSFLDSKMALEITTIALGVYISMQTMILTSTDLIKMKFKSFVKDVDLILHNNKENKSSIAENTNKLNTIIEEGKEAKVAEAKAEAEAEEEAKAVAAPAVELS